MCKREIVFFLSENYKSKFALADPAARLAAQRSLYPARVSRLKILCLFQEQLATFNVCQCQTVKLSRREIPFGKVKKKYLEKSPQKPLAE